MNDSQLAEKTARLLGAYPHSPFFRQIRLGKASESLIHPKELSSKIPADLGTSLIGLARVGLSFHPDMDQGRLASYVVSAGVILNDRAPHLLAVEKALTPLPDATHGAILMVIGVALGLAYRIGRTGQERPSETTKDRLADAAKETLDLDAAAVRTAPDRRKLLGDFVRAFLADMTFVGKLDGIPVDLMTCLSRSAFGPPRDAASTVETTRLPVTPAVEAKTANEKKVLAVLERDPDVVNLGYREIGRRCDDMDGKTVKTILDRFGVAVPVIKKVKRNGTIYFQDGKRP